MKKRIILAVIMLSVICTSIFIVSTISNSSQKNDYKKYEEIPEGYVDCDEKEVAGKDYDYLGWYKYEEAPTLIDAYKQVGDNEEMVKRAMNLYTGNTGVTYSYDEETGEVTEEKDPDGYLAELVSDDDYFILQSFNEAGEEIVYPDKKFNEERYSLYFFDTESTTLYVIRVVW